MAGLEKTNLTVGAVPVADEAGLYIAQDEGLFAQEGLHVTIKSIVSSADATSGQNDGKYDITAGNVGFLHAGSGNPPVRPGDRRRGLADAAGQPGAVHAGRVADHDRVRAQGRAGSASTR